MIEDIFNYLTTDKYYLGVVSIISIASFALTIIVSLRTSNINKILRYNKTTDEYNKQRKSFLKSFEGHRQSILEDNIKTAKILNDILVQAESYKAKFKPIFSFEDRMDIFLLIRQLKRDYKKADWNKICNYLAKISGRLTIKEETKNG